MKNMGRKIISLLVVLMILAFGLFIWQKKVNLNFSSQIISPFKLKPEKIKELTAESAEKTKPVLAVSEQAISLEESFIKVAEEVKPAVVNISTVQVIKGRKFSRGLSDDFFKDHPFDEFFRDFFEHSRPRHKDWKQRSLGSGIIIDKEGYILTNNHVIAKASEIKVVLAKEEEYEAKIIGRDAKTDLAIIKIDAKRDLPAASLGNSDQLRVGQWAIAIGNAFGLHRSVTVGVISATGRSELGITTYENFIQTDASINRGNSGGPLLNIRGEVIGVNTAIVGGASGIGFAIPINMAKEVLTDLIEKGKVDRGWLGVIIQPISPELKDSFGLKNKEGALVSDVLKDGPAEKAGIKRGDIIIRFNGRPIKNIRELQRAAAGAKTDILVKLDIIRDNKPGTLEVKIGGMPQELFFEEEEKGAVDERELWMGMQVQEITRDLAHQFNLSIGEGVIVTHIDSDSPADSAGVEVRDIILEINGRPIENAEDYEELVNKLKRDANAVVLIKRGRYTTFLVIKGEEK